MDEAQDIVARHYRAADVEERILSAVRRLGGDPEKLNWQDIAPADEFHIGGAPAALRLATAAGIGPGTTVLDIGSGIGGPARLFAAQLGATVEGVDLIPEFVDVAISLTRRCGLEHQVGFTAASAVDLPFADAVFDAACLLHVGMNVPDKELLFSEAARVIRPGGSFAVYDIMAADGGTAAYPLPWAADAAGSFPARPEAYLAAASAAGLEMQEMTDHTVPAVDFMTDARDRMIRHGPPVMGLHLVLRPDGAPAMANLLDAFQARTLTAVQMVFSRPG